MRRVVGPDAIVGLLDAHAPSRSTARLGEPISYLAIGPVFSTATKATGYDAVGYAAVAARGGAAAARGLPVVAIGGITLETAPQRDRGRRAVGGGHHATCSTAIPRRASAQYLSALA